MWRNSKVAYMFAQLFLIESVMYRCFSNVGNIHLRPRIVQAPVKASRRSNPLASTLLRSVQRESCSIADTASANAVMRINTHAIMRFEYACPPPLFITTRELDHNALLVLRNVHDRSRVPCFEMPNDIPNLMSSHCLAACVEKMFGGVLVLA
jgi:hypothetical protein